MAKPLLRLSIYSDIACPWCYVGKKRMDQALTQIRKKADAQIEWHAYLLDPAFPESGVDIDTYGARKFGPRFPALKQRVLDSGRPDGAAFSNWRWRSNTLKGHMLVALAREHGKDHEAAELLFQASYERGANVGDLSVLLDIAAQLGLKEEAERRLGPPRSSAPAAGASGAAVAAPSSSGAEAPACGLGDGAACAADAAPGAAAGGAAGGGEEEEGGVDGELLKSVQMDDLTAKTRLQVSGVPFFLVGAEGTSRRYALSGAQPVQEFVEVFERVLAEAGAAS